MNQNAKHVFILNPVAGKGKMQSDLQEQIERTCAAAGVDYEIHLTGSVGEATEFVRHTCKQHPELSLRFYACGGDGTLSETVNGAHGFANAEVGVIPVGTGNDFVRNFAHSEVFLDIGAQLQGESIGLDLMQYNGKLCANMINIGFDCEVVKQTAKLKKNKLVPKSLTYIVGLVITLIRKPGVKAGVSFDGGEVQHRNMLLTSVANGAFCGGGFHSTPLALLQDGVLDMLLIKNVSRTRFLTLVSMYKNGTFVGHPRAKRIIDYVKCQQVKYYFDGVQSICVDGEVVDVRELEIGVVRDALQLIVPKGAAYAPVEQARPVGIC